MNSPPTSNRKKNEVNYCWTKYLEDVKYTYNISVHEKKKLSLFMMFLKKLSFNTIMMDDSSANTPDIDSNYESKSRSQEAYIIPSNKILIEDITKETPLPIFFENDNIKEIPPFPDTECSNNELSYNFEAPWFPDVIETKNEKHEGIVFIKNARNLGNDVIIIPNINKINYEIDQKNQNVASSLELNDCDLTNRHITDHYISDPSTLDKYYKNDTQLTKTNKSY
ncbi:hypothetical protein CDIK_3850 [Cucumispora dikerogammari]|nr:hypothetical protein CDIK_3850 [Cucumispora dikerogammari]